jgi:PST family polysaccharide transporter
VSLPAFARLGERGDDELSAGVTSSLSLLFLVTVPIAALIAALSGPLVHFLYGVKWLPSAAPLRFLMILMAVNMLTGLGMDILVSTGRTGWNVVVNAGWFAVLVPALWFATKADGTRGTAIAQATVGVLVAIPLVALALSRVGVRLGALGRRMIRPLLCGLLTWAVAAFLGHAFAFTGPFFELAIAGTLGLLTYTFTAVPRGDLKMWISVLRRRGAPAAA